MTAPAQCSVIISRHLHNFTEYLLPTYWPPFHMAVFHITCVRWFHLIFLPPLVPEQNVWGWAAKDIFTGRCPSCNPTDTVKALTKAVTWLHPYFMHHPTPDRSIVTSLVGAVAKYCNEYVSLCVCASVYLRKYLRNHMRDLYQIFCACCS